MSLANHHKLIVLCMEEALPAGSVHAKLCTHEDLWGAYVATNEVDLDFELFYVVDRHTGQIWYFYDNVSDCPIIVRSSIICTRSCIQVVNVTAAEDYEWLRYATTGLDTDCTDMFDHSLAYLEKMQSIWSQNTVELEQYFD